MKNICVENSEPIHNIITVRLTESDIKPQPIPSVGQKVLFQNIHLFPLPKYFLSNQDWQYILYKMTGSLRVHLNIPKKINGNETLNGGQAH